MYILHKFLAVEADSSTRLPPELTLEGLKEIQARLSNKADGAYGPVLSLLESDNCIFMLRRLRDFFIVNPHKHFIFVTVNRNLSKDELFLNFRKYCNDPTIDIRPTLTSGEAIKFFFHHIFNIIYKDGVERVKELAAVGFKCSEIKGTVRGEIGPRATHSDSGKSMFSLKRKSKTTHRSPFVNKVLKGLRNDSTRRLLKVIETKQAHRDNVSVTLSSNMDDFTSINVTICIRQLRDLTGLPAAVTGSKVVIACATGQTPYVLHIIPNSQFNTPLAFRKRLQSLINELEEKMVRGH
jgi:hypothetical protein